METSTEKDKQILEQVQKTMRAYDDLPRLDPNPFLFTRIQAAIRKEHTVPVPRLFGTLRFRSAVIAVLIIINIVTAILVLTSRTESSLQEQVVAALSEEYGTTHNDYSPGN